MKSISVIIPVYNVKPYLRRCLDSVVGQTHRDVEIVCVDDGSTDGSSDVFDEYAAQDARIVAIHQKNSGTLMARQVAVSRASGEWCLFLDPDDWLEADACERFMAVAANPSVDLIACGFNIRETVALSPDRRKAVNAYFNSPAGLCERAELFDRCFVKRTLPWNLIGKMVRTEICKAAFAEQAKVYSIESEDMYALYHVIFRVRRGAIVDARLYNYSYSIGISTKPRIDMQEFVRSMGKVATLDELRRFKDRMCVDCPVAEEAFACVERHVIRSMFVSLAERMEDPDDRHRAFRLLMDSFPADRIACVLAETYGKIPLNLAQLLDGCSPFERLRATKGIRRLAVLFPANVPQRTMRLATPMIEGWQKRGIEVVTLRDATDVPAEGVDRVAGICGRLQSVAVDLVCSFRCDTVGAIWDVLACRLACGVPSFLCHHGDFTSAMYSHPSVSLYNYEPYWLRLFDGVLAQTALDALAFAAEGADAFELKAEELARMSLSAFEGRSVPCRRAVALEELSEMLRVQRKGLMSLHERRTAWFNQTIRQKVEEASGGRLASDKKV